MQAPPVRMRVLFLILGIALTSSLPLLKGGSVSVLGEGPGVDGKLTLEPNSVRIDTARSPMEIKLADVLEANFGEAPFQLGTFSSLETPGTSLPEGWKAQDIGGADTPGSLSYADGTFTLGGGGTENNKVDKFFFAGQPWSGDGQWTARVKEIHADAQAGHAEAGLMVREGWEPNALQVWAGATTNEDELAHDYFRQRNGSLHFSTFPFQCPLWLRLTRSGESIDLSTSGDGKKWEVISQESILSSGDLWVGLYFDSHKDKAAGKAVFDQVTFTPLPAPSNTFLPGILLRSGSFLMGGIGPFSPTSGTLFTKTQVIKIATAQAAMIAFYPVERSQLADAQDHAGILLKNGDFLAGEIQQAAGGIISLNSIMLGLTDYKADTVRACIFQQAQPQPADYEIRLRDGSILQAKSISLDNGQFTIEESSGIRVNAAPEDIAQFRAGSSRVQSLIDLPWKVTSSEAAKAPAPPDAASLIQSWMGNNREEILAVPTKTPIEFPLTGPFRTISLRVAVAPGGPPTGQASLHVLVNGAQVYTTPILKSGDQPLAVKTPLHDAKSVTLVADSATEGTKILLIDPVAIRGE